MQYSCIFDKSDEPCERIDSLRNNLNHVAIKVDRRAYLYKIFGLLEQIFIIGLMVSSIVLSLLGKPSFCHITSIFGAISAGLLLLRPIFDLTENSKKLKRGSSQIKRISNELHSLRMSKLPPEKINKKIDRYIIELCKLDVNLFLLETSKMTNDKV